MVQAEAVAEGEAAHHPVEEGTRLGILQHPRPVEVLEHVAPAAVLEDEEALPRRGLEEDVDERD